MLRPLIVALLLLPVPVRAAELAVTDAFSRASPGSGPGVAYLTIQGGDAADRLLGVSSPRAVRVEMHAVDMQGEVMRMREIGGIDVAPGGTVTFVPGGMHLMLVGMPTPLKAGETVTLTLLFEKAGPRTVQVPVGPVGAAGPPRSVTGSGRTGSGATLP